MSGVVARSSTGRRSRRVRGRRQQNRRDAQPITRQAVKQMLTSKMELKFFDNEVSGQSLSTTPSQATWSAVPQGDTDSTRDGDQINPRWLEIRYNVDQGSTLGTADVTNNIRVSVFRWLAPSSSSVPIVQNFLQYSSGTAYWLSPIAWDFKSNTQLIYDKLIGLSSQGPSVFVEMVKIPLKGLIQYQAGSSTLQNGGIYVIASCDSAVTPTPTLSYIARLVYTDA